MSFMTKGYAIVVKKEHLNADTAMGWYLGMDSLPPDELALKFFTGIDSSIVQRVKPNDILICGRNFGFGKVHNSFFTAIKMHELECIVAESFSTQMFQMGLTQGIYLVECPNILQNVDMGDEIEVDIENAVVRNITKNITINGKKLPQYIIDVMEAGGHMGYLLSTMDN
ncbi:3-isopropylmalate dehydratase small subunit [Fusibacter bizertensis]